MKEGIILYYFKVLYDNITYFHFFKKSTIKFNRFNFFPRDDKDNYIEINDANYTIALRCIYECLFDLFYPDYFLIMDAFCVDVRKAKNELIGFFSQYKNSKYNIQRYASFLIDSIELLEDFVKNFCPYCDDLVIRVIEKEKLTILENAIIPINNFRNRYHLYTQYLTTYYAIILLSVNSIFVEILSQKTSFEGYENKLSLIANRYNFLVKQNIDK